MSQAFCCDGCGEYHDGRSPASVRIHREQQVGERERHDLCEQCYQNVRSWMDELSQLGGDE